MKKIEEKFTKLLPFACFMFYMNHMVKISAFEFYLK